MADTPKERADRARRLRDAVERLKRSPPPAPRTPREFTQPPARAPRRTR